MWGGEPTRCRLNAASDSGMPMGGGSAQGEDMLRSVVERMHHHSILLGTRGTGAHTSALLDILSKYLRRAAEHYARD